MLPKVIIVAFEFAAERMQFAGHDTVRAHLEVGGQVLPTQHARLGGISAMLHDAVIGTVHNGGGTFFMVFEQGAPLYSFRAKIAHSGLGRTILHMRADINGEHSRMTVWTLCRTVRTYLLMLSEVDNRALPRAGSGSGSSGGSVRCKAAVVAADGEHTKHANGDIAWLNVSARQRSVIHRANCVCLKMSFDAGATEKVPFGAALRIDDDELAQGTLEHKNGRPCVLVVNDKAFHIHDDDIDGTGTVSARGK